MSSTQTPTPPSTVPKSRTDLASSIRTTLQSTVSGVSPPTPLVSTIPVTYTSSTVQPSAIRGNVPVQPTSAQRVAGVSQVPAVAQVTATSTPVQTVAQPGDQKAVVPNENKTIQALKELQKYMRDTWDSIIIKTVPQGEMPEVTLVRWASGNIKISTAFISKMLLDRGHNLVRYCGGGGFTSKTITRDAGIYVSHATALGLRTTKKGSGKTIQAALSILAPAIREMSHITFQKKQAKNEPWSYHGYTSVFRNPSYSFQGAIACIPLTNGLPELYDYCQWCFGYAVNSIEFIKAKNPTARLPILTDEFEQTFYCGLLAFMPFSLYCWTNKTKLAWVNDVASWSDIEPVSNSGITVWTTEIIADMVSCLIVQDKNEWVEICKDFPLN